MKGAMRLAVRKFVRSDMECFIDGLPVCHLERFEGESPLFHFSAPDDNILIGAGPVSGNAVSAGTYVMVPPLSVGHHVIRFKGTQTDPVFGSAVFGGTYHITVTGSGHGHDHDHRVQRMVHASLRGREPVRLIR